ncbi:gas vesicle accessory protein GvpU [Viridibacillus arvi]|uniref:gas vesicle accessory protein GvpU n=1 Tax=Viridibacillus arvi TaxID=263475 RepID=UPI003D29A4B8
MKDVVLNTFVNIANSPKGIGISVTLNVKGTMISGVLISYEEYLKLMAESFGESDDVWGIGKMFSEGFAELISDKQIKIDVDRDADYIHIKDVKILDPSGGFINSKIWRGKLESIDGFIFGSLGEK